MRSGIYRIACKATATSYIGQSVNILSRWRNHHKQLRAGTHHNPYLQAAWDKYGADAFEFAVEVRCGVEQLGGVEQQVFDEFRNACDALFNVNDDPVKPARGGKRPDNAERLRKMHADPVQQARLMRGLRERAQRLKGTDEARRLATHASHSRVRKPKRVRLHKGTPEHSAMVSAQIKAMHAAGVFKNPAATPVVRRDTGERFSSVKRAAESLGVSSALLCYHMKRSGLCKGVRVDYME